MLIILSVALAGNRKRGFAGDVATAVGVQVPPPALPCSKMQGVRPGDVD